MSVEPLGVSRIKRSFKGSALGIEIPARKRVIQLPFLAIWLAAWTVGGIMVMGGLFGSFGNSINLFLAFWLCGWAIGWCYVAFSIFWMLFGRERIFLTSGVLTHQFHLFFPWRTKRYEVAHIKRVRNIGEPSSGFASLTRNRRNPMGSPGLSFDYGSKSRAFGYGADSAEAYEIIEILKKHMPSVFKQHGSD
ncbi:hypothetical protein ACFQ14_16615 [Pseudahrensia aquimaris]|uniref:PH domain-containing protein n=1 Tax=Pseudahrensia aquimaris TaxID=744461 RepID=A0ABW3FPE7_9HYPH